MELIFILTLIVGSYLLGSIPFGVFIAKRCGVDIRREGSRNIGATNVWRTCGWFAGSLAFLLDVAKGFLPSRFGVAVVEIMSGSSIESDWNLAFGTAAILGHAFSIFLGFRGGKAVATALGLVLGVAIWEGVISFGVFALVLLVTRYVSLSSLVACTSVVVLSFFFDKSWLVVSVLGVLYLLIIVRHIPNMRRLMEGTERRFSLRLRKKSAADDSDSTR